MINAQQKNPGILQRENRDQDYFSAGALGTLTAVHCLENLQIQNNESEELDEFIVHHGFVLFRNFHELTSLFFLSDNGPMVAYSGIIFQPMRPWSLCMNVVWIMRFIQAPARPISMWVTN